MRLYSLYGNKWGLEVNILKTRPFYWNINQQIKSCATYKYTYLGTKIIKSIGTERLKLEEATAQSGQYFN